VKIIPYALPEAVVYQAEELGQVGDPIIQLLEFARRRVGLILMGDVAVRPRLQRDFEAPIRERVERIGSDLMDVDFVPVGEEEAPTGISAALGNQVDAGCEMIILAGQTAVMDEDDIVPRAVVAAGGVVESIGAPVDPGNLLMLAYIDKVPIVGAPGCARSRKENVVDWILPRLAIGERIRREDIIELGHGGLLEDFPERSVPRMETGGQGA
jgi:molybdopterin biosynthesis enzyme